MSLSSIRATLVLLGCFGVSFVSTSLGQSPPSRTINRVTTLTAGVLDAARPLAGKLNGGETHTYELKLTSGQIVRIAARQQGVDVTLRLSDPDGKKIVEVDDFRSERGAEKVSMITELTGVYRLEVGSANRTALRGDYEVIVEKLETAGDEDRAVVSAERLFTEGNQLLYQGSKESATKAIARYEAALTVFALAANLRMKAVLLNRIGRAYFYLLEYEKALDYHQQALLLARNAGDRVEEATAIDNLGQTCRAANQNEKALEYLRQSAQLWHLLEDRRAELEALINLGGVQYLMGDIYTALFYYDRAIELARIIHDRHREARLLTAIGLAHYAAGDYQPALQTWQQGLVVAREARYESMETVILSHLGAVYGELGESQKALTILNEAAERARASGDQAREAGVLQTTARVYRSMGDSRKSIVILEQSLVLLKDARNRGAEARSYYNLGKAHTDLGEYQKAYDYLQRALRLWNETGDTINAAAAIKEMARLERNRGDLSMALKQIDAALNLAEWVRARAGADDLRDSYLASVQSYFEFKIDLLAQLHHLNPGAGYAAAALQTSEQSRARTMVEAIAAVGVDTRQGIPAELIERERNIQKQLSLKATEQVRLANANAASDQLFTTEREIQELSANYGQIKAEIRSTSGRYAKLVHPEAIDLPEIQKQLADSETVLLEYALGDERSYLWLVTRDSMEFVELPKRAVIEEAARNVYSLLSARNQRIRFEKASERRARIEQADAQYPQAAAHLSSLVLGPVAARLRNRRLLVAGDGALQYIPFAALPYPDPAASVFKPLALTNEIVNLPSASALSVLRREARSSTPPRTLAVFADPVFDRSDDRVRISLAAKQRERSNEAVPTLNAVNLAARSARESGWEVEEFGPTRLPFTRFEADAISSLVPANQSQELLDFAANLEAATNGDLSQYRIIHFATHGFLNSRHPELSGIVLSLVNESGAERDGFLRAHEIYDLNLPADLIVLSGCRTGLGREIRGEGIVGLTRAFMHAGAKRVMVSLWNVNDEATAELMRRFYLRLLGDTKSTPAAALQAAQASMSQDSRWSAPYFWAGFSLQGEPQ